MSTFFVTCKLTIDKMTFRLQSDNRRLQQELAEQRQVIQLLEMQKSILTKTVSLCHSSRTKYDSKSQRTSHGVY